MNIKAHILFISGKRKTSESETEAKKKKVDSLENILLYYLEYQPQIGQRILEELDIEDLRGLSRLGSNELDRILSRPDYRDYFANLLTSEPTGKPAAKFGRYKWMYLFRNARISETAGEAFFKQAYELFQLEARIFPLEYKLETYGLIYPSNPLYVTFVVGNMLVTKRMLPHILFELNCSIGYVLSNSILTAGQEPSGKVHRMSLGVDGPLLRTGMRTVAIANIISI